MTRHRPVRPKQHCEKCGGDLFEPAHQISDAIELPAGHRGLKCLSCGSVRLIKTRTSAAKRRRQALLIELLEDKD